MSTSIANAIVEASHVMRKAGVPEPRREAGSLLAYIIGRDRTYILAHAEDSLTSGQLDRFREFVELRATGKPLQYITGHQEFFNLDFEVTTDVLIPRPETELLVEAALKFASGPDAVFVCEIGTGSGCIVVSLLHELPRALAVAVDVSPAALEVAKKNATKHGVIDRIDFKVSDCFAALDPAAHSFGLIVSNPPYVKDGNIPGLQREVRDHEPRVALEAGEDGLNVVRKLLADAPPFLTPGGHMLFEIGFDQGAVVEELIDRNNWKLLNIHPDLQGIPRIVELEKIS